MRKLFHSLCACSIMLVMIACNLDGVESATCCADTKDKCPACPSNRVKACTKLPQDKNCGGTCDCRKKDKCKTNADCSKMKDKCKDNKEAPFLICGSVTENDAFDLAYMKCVCVENPDCKTDTDCQEYGKLKCKTDEVSKCDSGVECTCEAKPSQK